MAQRGRKSAADLAIVRSNSISAISRPSPPKELTTEQANEWLQVVNRMPADWFPRETHGLLAQYCRHVVSARRVADLVESLLSGETESSDWLGDFDKLLKMQEREGRAISSLATRMRISQQAQYSKDKKSGKPSRDLPHLS